MNLIEMEGFLHGKGIPGDLKVNESNASYLVRKFAEMEAKCAALAAENAGLKESRQRLAEFIHEELDVDYPLNMDIKTPATDAYRDELRAQGIEMAAKSDQFSMWVQQGLRSFAIGVRQGGERELTNLERNVLECAAVIAKDRERGGAAQ